MMYNPMDNENWSDMGGRCHGGPFGEYGEGPACMPRGGGHGMGGRHTMPGGGFDAGPHCMPRGHGEPGGPGGFGPGGHRGPGGFGPGGPGGPGGFGPGGFGPGGMPPRRPDPAFLKRRIADSDLMELIDMAGRMAQRRPRGGPARGQALILSILAGRDALSQRELQQMLGIQPGSLSELLSKLEVKGFLTREKAEDRRGNLLRITEAGREAIPRVDELPEDDAFAPLTDEEQDQLAALLRALLNHWADAMEDAAPCRRRPPFPHRDEPVEV